MAVGGGLIVWGGELAAGSADILGACLSVDWNYSGGENLEWNASLGLLLPESLKYFHSNVIDQGSLHYIRGTTRPRFRTANHSDSEIWQEGRVKQSHYSSDKIWVVRKAMQY